MRNSFIYHGAGKCCPEKSSVQVRKRWSYTSSWISASFRACAEIGSAQITEPDLALRDQIVKLPGPKALSTSWCPSPWHKVQHCFLEVGRRPERPLFWNFRWYPFTFFSFPLSVDLTCEISRALTVSQVCAKCCIRITPNLILKLTVWSMCSHYRHLIDGKSEAQKSLLTRPGSYS